MFHPRLTGWSVAAFAAATFLASLAPHALASHEAGASATIRQEPTQERCHAFYVELDDLSAAQATLTLWEHGEGSAPDSRLHEEDVALSADDDGRFDAVVGPFTQDDTSGATEGLYVRVAWRDDEGFHSLMSDHFTLQCEGGPGPIPDCPDDLRAHAQADGSVRLTWSAVEGAESYIIFRGADSVPWSVYDSTTQTEYVDVHTTEGTRYTYTVRTYADRSEAIGCEDVVVVAQRDAAALPCPPDVVAVAHADGGIMLTWGHVPMAEGYRIHRSVDGETFTLVGDLGSAVDAFRDAGTDAGVTYHYRVTAFRADAESEACATVEATAVPFFGAPLLGALATAGGAGAYALLRRRRA